ncbi:MAG: Crp/Fnr family transcriptional regulator [Pseudomonadota bacterium]|uniref:Crp/Fnr family transcriptional regulator n=1 Tax=Novosphingobium sp. MBES04 TaxID=1206458 RepID=UPI00057D43C3|nr:Crp/Fnr family transcriptional regulator [Novosphingobium sp. MBES04]MED5544862.1 Crp/Fnr family transcriptional regulator [Pseudomonadota bacterium]GAM03183.1 transcriptional regulator [Novosphingobium sp. MBES04]
MDAMALNNDNALLERLEARDRDALSSAVEEVRFESGAVLYEPGTNIDYCYFPTGSAICSYFVEMDEGVAVETILIGREGALGGVVSHGNLPAFARSNVLHGGVFQRIALRDLDRLKRDNPAVAHLMNRYSDCVMAQVFQSIACNAVHTIEQRAAKWLVAAVARMGRPSVTMTQEQLASMMGVGRSYASRVLQRFKRDGLLRTRRGGIEVLDRDGLANRACACNDHVDAHFERVLGGLY